MERYVFRYRVVSVHKTDGEAAVELRYLGEIKNGKYTPPHLSPNENLLLSLDTDTEEHVPEPGTTLTVTIEGAS